MGELDELAGVGLLAQTMRKTLWAEVLSLSCDDVSSAQGHMG